LSSRANFPEAPERGCPQPQLPEAPERGCPQPQFPEAPERGCPQPQFPEAPERGCPQPQRLPKPSACGLAHTVFPSHRLRVRRPALRLGCGCAALGLFVFIRALTSDFGFRACL